MDFNNLVKSKRNECGLSLEELSKITNISESTPKKMERITINRGANVDLPCV